MARFELKCARCGYVWTYIAKVLMKAVCPKCNKEIKLDSQAKK